MEKMTEGSGFRIAQAEMFISRFTSRPARRRRTNPAFASLPTCRHPGQLRLKRHCLEKHGNLLASEFNIGTIRMVGSTQLVRGVSSPRSFSAHVSHRGAFRTARRLEIAKAATLGDSHSEPLGARG
jgi:hypothetical protein